MTLSKVLAEASLNPITWITTRTGAHVPIQDNGFSPAGNGALFSKSMNATIGQRPDNGKYVSRSDVASVVNSMPKSVQGLKINYASNTPKIGSYGYLNNTQFAKTRVAGDYDAQNKTINIYPTSAIDNFFDGKLIVSHEVGHAVYDTFSKEQQDEWQKIHKDDKNYVNDYAKQEFGEDFAESYAYYKLSYVDRPLSIGKLSDSRRKFFEKQFGKT